MGVSSIGAAAPPMVSASIPSVSPNGPVTAGTAGGVSSPSDSVSVSGLAKALRGDSLTAFNALSDKQRSQLVSLVDSGKITGEEVSDALKQRLKQARASAIGAAGRMFGNDHADLLSKDSADVDNLPGVLNNALSETLAKRSALMDKLTTATDAGLLSSTSDALMARETNPKLLVDRTGHSGMIMPGFFGLDFEDSRINYTKREGDAAYKLKSLGVDFHDLDASLRGIGEKDAAAILSERAGLSTSRKVAGDPDFSLDDAVVKPLGPPKGSAAAGHDPFAEAIAAREEMIRDIFANAKRVAVGNGIYKIDLPELPPLPKLDVKAIGGENSSGVSVDYFKGLMPRY